MKKIALNYFLDIIVIIVGISHKVHLFPDVGKYEGWQERKKGLIKEYPFADIEVSRECELWFEKGQIEKGDDIADYYLGL